MPRQAIASPELFNYSGFAHVVRAGDLLVISGQVPQDRDGELVGAGDVELQVDQVFSNLCDALAAADAGFDDVVKLTVFATHNSVLAAMRKKREELMNEPRPASTFLVVAGLADPGFMVEIEALAYKPRKSDKRDGAVSAGGK